MQSLIKLVAELLSISGLVVAFGYMELRAHWTHLGVSVIPGVGADRYLMEAYAFVGMLLLPLFAAAVVVLLVVQLFSALRATLSRSRHEGRIRTFEERGAPYVVLLLLIAAELVLLGSITGDTSIGIGPLAAATRHRHDSPVVFLAIAAVALLALHVARKRTGGWRVALTAGAVVLLLQLPTLYGRTVRDANYVAVRLWTSASPPASHIGLIVLQSDSAVEVWTVVGGKGRMIVLPRSEITRIDIGRALSLAESAKAFAGDATGGAFLKKACIE